MNYSTLCCAKDGVVHFDNSAGQVTIDVLHRLTRCLQARPRKDRPDTADTDFPSCANLDETHLSWMRTYLRPQVLMVRNGDARPRLDDDRACPARRGGAPSKLELQPPDARVCPEDNDPTFQPETPACVRRADVFVDFLGPALGLGACSSGSRPRP